MSNTEAKLLPCPFCGEHASYVKIDHVTYQYRVQCDSCGAMCGGSASRNDTYNSNTWNTRQSIPKERLEEFLEKLTTGVEESCDRPTGVDTAYKAGALAMISFMKQFLGSMEGKGCGTCNDTGEIYTGETSCLSDDGDAPITERCPDCNPRQKVKV